MAHIIRIVLVQDSIQLSPPIQDLENKSNIIANAMIWRDDDWI
jgi:hypothetical protein